MPLVIFDFSEDLGANLHNRKNDGPESPQLVFLLTGLVVLEHALSEVIEAHGTDILSTEGLLPLDSRFCRSS